MFCDNKTITFANLMKLRINTKFYCHKTYFSVFFLHFSIEKYNKCAVCSCR